MITIIQIMIIQTQRLFNYIAEYVMYCPFYSVFTCDQIKQVFVDCGITMKTKAIYFNDFQSNAIGFGKI